MWVIPEGIEYALSIFDQAWSQAEIEKVGEKRRADPISSMSQNGGEAIQPGVISTGKVESGDQEETSKSPILGLIDSITNRAGFSDDRMFDSVDRRCIGFICPRPEPAREAEESLEPSQESFDFERRASNAASCSGVAGFWYLDFQSA